MPRPKQRAPKDASRRDPSWDVPRIAYLYADPTSPTLRLPEVADSLEDTLGIPCEVRGEFLGDFAGADIGPLSREIAGTRVRHLGRPFEPMEPLFGEVEFERRLLEDPEKRVPGVLYDGFRYMAVLRSLLPREEATLSVLHLAFQHRLLGTFDADGRYHARAVICGYPSIVSTSGIVEAPAKPEAYYKVKAQLSIALGAVPFEAAKEPFQGQFVDYDDPRLTEVAKGYALQAAMYHVTKEPFCEDPGCRLFNAHWQVEVLRAQVESGRLCSRHENVADAIRAASSSPPPPRQRKVRPRPVTRVRAGRRRS